MRKKPSADLRDPWPLTPGPCILWPMAQRVLVFESDASFAGELPTANAFGERESMRAIAGAGMFAWPAMRVTIARSSGSSFGPNMRARAASKASFPPSRR